jgi:hypothetical protein
MCKVLKIVQSRLKTALKAAGSVAGMELAREPPDDKATTT